LEHFVSKDAMNIEGMGKFVIEGLVEKGYIKSPADIYYLTADQLKSLWKNGSASAEKLLNAIDASKNRDLGRLIYAFGIKNVGLKTGQALSRSFGNLKNLMASSVESIMCVEDIGELTARSIYDWLKQPQSIKMIERLDAANVNFACNTNSVGSKYAGLTFVFTGALRKFTREEAIERIEKYGGLVKGSVSKNTNYLIVGDNAGSKAKRAEELGVPYLTEDQFRKFLGMDE
jgi:DNA ligase (NAD+)